MRWLGWLALAVYFVCGLSYLALRHVVWPNSHYWLPQAEQALSRALGRPIEIAGVRAGFDGLRPSLEIERLSARDDDGTVAMSARRVHAVVSLRSLAIGQLAFARLDLDAPVLRIERLAHRRLRAAGVVFDIDRPGTEGGGLDWLFAQRAITLRDAQLHWVDRISGRELRLEGVQLALGSVGRRHRATLQVPSAPGLGEQLVLAIEILRPAFSRIGDWRRWNGEVHVAAGQADLAAATALADELRALRSGGAADDDSRKRDGSDSMGDGSDSTGDGGNRAGSGVERLLARLDVDAGAIALQLWARFDDGLPSDGLLRVAGRGLAMRVDGTPLPLSGTDLEAELARAPAGETHLRLRRLALDDGSDFELELAGRAPQRLRIGVDGRLAGGELSLARFDPAKLLAIARALPLPGALAERLAPLRVSGTVESAHLLWDGDASYELDLRFEGLSFARDEAPPPPPALGLPSFAGVSGRAVLDASGGRLQLRGRKTTLSFPGLFAEPDVPLEVLDASVRWHRIAGDDGADGWIDVDIDSFRFAAADAAGELAGRYSSAGKRLGSVDLEGRLSRADATRVARYLPLAIDVDVRDWVARSIVAGRSNDVRFVLRGELRDFPFREPASGEFHVEAAMQGVRLAYWPGWPALEGIDGRLVFSGAGMIVEAGSGRLWGTTLGPVRATIDEFREPVLLVDGSGQGPAQDLLRFVQNSPVRDEAQAIPAGLRADGAARLKLDLEIPLRHVAQARVHGLVELGGNELVFDPHLPAIEKLTGRIEFTERSFELHELAGSFLGGPLRASGATEKSGDFRLQADGRVDAAGLRALADNALTRALDGATDWRASVDLRQGTRVLSLESELAGLASRLPTPFAKAASEAWPLRIELAPSEAPPEAAPSGSGTADTERRRELLRVALRDDALLLVEGERAPGGQGMEIRRGAFALGAEPLLPDSGLSLSLNAPAIDVDAWAAAFGPISAGDRLSVLRPSRVSLSAQRLRIAGKELNEIVLGATRSDDRWRANVRAREVDGHLSWRSAVPGQVSGGIVARFGRLEIPASRVGEVESLFDSAPSELPELDIEADEFVLNEHRLGSLAVKARNVGDPAAPVWRLEQLRIENPSATLDAHGDWRIPRDGRQRTSSLDFELALRDAGAVLELLGFPGTMRGGAGSLNGELSWTGSPLAIDLPSLSGKLDLSLGKGSFPKAEPGIAKLIGVLNLQSLPRRLAFDFHDLFSEGFAFDDIHGSVLVHDGIARSEEFVMRGVTAQVRLRGEVDIARETQDLLVEVRPELNAALASLAYAAMVNPAVGIGSLLAQLLLREPLRELFAWEYELTGSWSEPELTTRSRPTLPEAVQPPQGG